MKSKKIEMWGLILVLLSSFVQFFILTKSQDITSGAVNLKLETKLDLIFLASRSNFQTLQPEPSNAYIKVNPEIFNNYRYVGQDSRMETTKTQTEWFRYIVGALFLIGSGLIIVAKKMEIDAIEGHSHQPRL